MDIYSSNTFFKNYGQKVRHIFEGAHQNQIDYLRLAKMLVVNPKRKNIKMNNIFTIKKKPRSPRKPSKKELMEKRKRDQTAWEKKHKLEYFQFVGQEILQLAFYAAVKLMDIADDSDKLDIKQAFVNSFEYYARARQYVDLVGEYGIQSISDAKWIDQKWYHLTERDLFLALSPKAQARLHTQGVSYV